MNLPNRLTLARIFLVPVFLTIVTLRIKYGDIIAAAVFILAASTDGLDGYIARKNKQITTLGKFMDPLADKLLVSAALIVLVELGKLPAWVAVIIIGREFMVTGLRAIAAADGVVISASKLGKWKTITQIIAIVAMFLYNFTLQIFGFDFARVAMGVAVFFTIWSGVDYMAKGWHLLKKGEY
ncbi:CDP-diacylglycerol/glycerol-3-phosphate 3-phosphatidyltransferase [Desulfotomaculum nigrificans CO-1-SRB]|uniref:CDP-diacylglycerol--glycerol-3-phosphate 3-phosphatidyltransferase n=1 Tax=Desulfotomaculum nigrificans (strain DSM 14880 / VKM B-2319 / CO-1-SRB) TaxID=868595 RepID=F6B5Z4_DESCC|nr:CDP-diacylglycerol--glycerol-3-phosphate 3-phosphatidyltransferase [Desulfotomaculum nigrificans]AEF94313.1 CDP-diacylglycerol/glycerol-3-phosphate 3-phosphatidyltransferase [Desulfotomaculum nigrificans CO-1-SRB]